MDESRTSAQCSDILDCSEAEWEVSMAETAAHSIREDVAPAGQCALVALSITECDATE
jgi:hypothetical protein